MCIIIYKPADMVLSPDTITNAFDNNPDGAGFAYVEDEKITVSKGFYTLEAFKEEYLPHERKQALLHFRIKTHGDYSQENCHPFEITPNLVFAHNGMIYKMPDDPIKSDTYLFNELLLRNLVRVYGKRILFDDKFKPFLESYSTSSKFVFLDNTGRFSIINEKDGYWDAKCWFSNKSYNYKKTKYTYHPPQDNIPKKKKKHLPQLPGPHGERSFPVPMQQNLPGVVAPNDRPWVIGDYLRPTIPLGMVDKGWLGKAMSFYANGDVEVLFPIRQMCKRLPAIYLERVVPTELKVED